MEVSLLKPTQLEERVTPTTCFRHTHMHCGMCVTLTEFWPSSEADSEPHKYTLGWYISYNTVGHRLGLLIS